MKVRRYESPAAFKAALEERLRRHGVGELTHRRQLLVFERFLARVVAGLGDDATLKGGLVLELRLERARTTKDVDLRVMGSPDQVIGHLRTLDTRDFGDFMTFDVAPHADHPVIDAAGLHYDGLRVYPVEAHVAEKLHAYTLPRARPNTRVKDLPDLALLAGVGPIAAGRLRHALEHTFSARNTHALPIVLPEPPSAWERPYGIMARKDKLPWTTLDECTTAVGAFLDPILAGARKATWAPEAWTWRSRPG